MLLLNAAVLLIAASVASSIAEPASEQATVNPTSVFCAVVTGLVTKAKAQPQATSYCSSYLSLKPVVTTKRIQATRYQVGSLNIQRFNITESFGLVIRLLWWSRFRRQQVRERDMLRRLPLPLCKCWALAILIHSLNQRLMTILLVAFLLPALAAEHLPNVA